jgi:hypothetical protein
MPKARKRRKGGGSGTSKAPPEIRQTQGVESAAGAPTARNRPFVSPATRGPRSLVMPALVALGCWGLAFVFTVFSSEPNHILFGAMAALLALLWTFSVAVRVRKLLLLRQKS